MTMSYIIVLVLLLKILNIAKGKTKQIKFPNLWLIPILFMGMVIEDFGKQKFDLSLEMIVALIVFGIIGLCMGWIRGKTLHYQIDSDNKIYYQESYTSLIIYMVIIAAKWGLKFIGGANAGIISTGLIIFAGGSIMGRCGYISYRYLRPIV